MFISLVLTYENDLVVHEREEAGLACIMADLGATWPYTPVVFSSNIVP